MYRPLPKQDLGFRVELTTEQKITIIKLCIYDLFDSEGIGRPHEVKIEQFAERVLHELEGEAKP